MSQPTTSIFLNSTTPAAPSGNQNVKPQSDGGTPLQSVSFYPQPATSSLLGVVRPDGSTITISDGVISATGGGGGAALLSGEGPPALAPTLVQATSGGGDSLAFTSNVASGDLLVVAFKSEGSIGSITISDTLGTIYALATSITGEANNMAVYYGLAPSSGANAVSIGSAPNNFDRLAVAEFLNVNATVDASATLWNGGGTNPESLSVTTTQANDLLVFAVAGYHDADVFAFSGGSTLDSQSNGSDANAIGHQIAGVAGSYTATVDITGAGADNSALILVAFEATGGSPGADGDFYLDITNGVLYGPRTSGAYSAVANGVVPQGVEGLVLATPTGASGPASLRALVSSDLPLATTSAPGAVQPDGSTITISGGVISAVGGGGGGGGVSFGSGSPNGTPASVVQSTSNSSSNTLAFASNVTSGDLLIVAFSRWGGSTPTGVTDSLGTSYTLIVDLTGGGDPLLVWAGIAPSSGTNTVTLTGGPGAYGVLTVMEVAGCTATIDTSNTGSSAPLAITTTFANDFLLGACAGGGGAFTWSLPFTLDVQDNSYGNAFVAIGHDIVSAAGTYTLTVTAGAVDNIAIVAFQTSASPLSGSEGNFYFDTTTTPYTGYVYHSSVWQEFS